MGRASRKNSQMTDARRVCGVSTVVLRGSVRAVAVPVVVYQRAKCPRFHFISLSHSARAQRAAAQRGPHGQPAARGPGQPRTSQSGERLRPGAPLRSRRFFEFDFCRVSVRSASGKCRARERASDKCARAARRGARPTVQPCPSENPGCASGHMSGAVVDLVCTDQLS